MAEPASKHVGLFVTCLVDFIRPSIGFAAVKLLEDAGCTVEVPRQACCGQPAFNSGDRATARDIAEQVIARLAGIWKAHVRIESVRWERAHYDAGKSFQEQVGEMAQFDVVCGIL